VAVVLWGTPAFADRAIDVKIEAVSPFDEAQLAAAIRLRLPVDGPKITVRVVRTASGLQVETERGVRDVAIAGLDGVEAARLVALAIDDLTLDDGLALPAVRRTRAPLGAPTVSALGAIGDRERPLDGALVTLAYPRRGWVLGFDAGLASPASEMLTITTATLRATAGVRLGWLELRAGATLMPLRVIGGVGDTTVLLGAGLGARLRIPVTSTMRAVLAGGVDAFANPTRYQIDGDDVFATGSLVPWLGVGVEVPL
jgi:hypothetical protein